MVLNAMHRRSRTLFLAGCLAAAGAAAAGAETPPAVTLPLAEYLAMVDKAEARERAAAATQQRAPALAEVIEERIAVRLDPLEARIDSQFEVVVQGEPVKPLRLPLAGYGATARIEKLDAGGAFVPATGAALAAFGGAEGGTALVAPEPGRYRVRVESRLPADLAAGPIELRLREVAAPVAAADFDLPAELEWTGSGAVLVDEKVEGDRRRLRFATQRGQAPALAARRRFSQSEESTLAHAVALTLFQLRPEGLRRHDVLLYEVSRGRLSAFEAELPAGLEIEQAASDEGPVVPIEAGGRLRVERRRQLQGTGYLMLSSTPASAGRLPLAPLRPAIEMRARYLAVASSIAAEIAPQPAAGFAQIDLADLPPLLGQALGAIDLAAAWRLQEMPDGAEEPALRLAPLPPADKIAGTVTRRETTTLLTVDGTLLHRETFELAASDRPISSFEVALPEKAVLWSTKVDGQPMRPLQRDGKVVLPIVPKAGAATSVEVVAVLEQAIAAGRSQLEIGLARVAAPVLEHNWRLLLPDAAKYRYAGGDLQPVPAAQVIYGSGAAVRSPAPGRQARGSAAIEGRVVFEGDALPGVTLTLDGPAGQLVATSGADGRYRFSELPAGGYQVMAELEGLATLVWEVQVAGGQRKTVDVPMRVGGVYEELVVTSALEDARAASAPSQRAETALDKVGKGKKERQEPDEEQEGRLAAANYSAQVGELQQGLVGGVKPLPITIPESGKSLVLSGVLPPEQVKATIDVKARK